MSKRKRQVESESVVLSFAFIHNSIIQLTAYVTQDVDHCHAVVTLPSNYPKTMFSDWLELHGKRNEKNELIICTVILSICTIKNWNWKRYLEYVHELGTFTHAIRLHHFVKTDKMVTKEVIMEDFETRIFSGLGFILVRYALHFLVRVNSLNVTTTGFFLEASGFVRNVSDQHQSFINNISSLTKRQLVCRINDLADSKPRTKYPSKSTLLNFYRNELIAQEEQRLLILYYKSKFGLKVLETNSYSSFMGNSLNASGFNFQH